MMYHEEYHNIRSGDGTEIPAIYAYDSSKKPERALLLLHGISTNKNEYLDFYRRLSKALVVNNIATLRIDFRGHGDSKLSPSSFSIATQLLDVIYAVKWLQHMKGFLTVDLFGSSFGAPPCIFASGIEELQIDRIYLLAPVLSYIRTFIHGETEWGRETFDNVVERTVLNDGKVYITEEFFVQARLVIEMLLIDIERAIQFSKRYFTVMHGDKDGMVNLGISEQLARKYERIILHIFPNMEHGFTDFADETGESPATEKNINRMVNIILGEV